MLKVRRLPVANPEAAIKLYYGKGYLNCNDIGEIFGTKSKTIIYEMKKTVVQVERSRNLPIVVPKHINAKIAFEIWGIDITELERNLKKLKELAAGI